MVGSSLLAQDFTQAKYFQPRPAAAGKDGYDPTASGGSNLGPSNPALLKMVADRVAAYRKTNGLAADAPVPVDAVTGAFSGRDPQISVANADIQARRVALARRVPLDQVLALVRAHTENRPLGVLGEKVVNVLAVNLALDRQGRRPTAWPAGSSESTWAPPPGSARPTRCSTRAAGVPPRHRRGRRLRRAARPPNTAAQVRDLKVVPRRTLAHRDQQFQEMDVDAILARHPAVALVDELAHSNVPGSRNAKRWQDVQELLAAGITVITTVNIQHLDSLNDVVEQITGVTQRETIPDVVVRAADQIELVDMSPEALRRRMAHGNIYPSEKVDTALANYFRPGNLAALRELALLWVADRVDEGLHDYRERHGIAQPWETRERVVVALHGTPSDAQLIRRGARMAARARAELLGVHVRATDGLAHAEPTALDHDRALLAEFDGRFVEVTGSDIPKALVEVARAENATQLLLGASHRSRWTELLHGLVINRVIRASGEIDVHVISLRQSPTRPDRGSSPVSCRRPG